MEPLIIVTGNIGKFKVVQKELGVPVIQQAIDIEEIQSLDLREILEAKARTAYRKIGKPIVVDDMSLCFNDLNGIPGPLIKWFEKSIGLDGLCKLAGLGKTRKATVKAGIGYYDGDIFESFISISTGEIAQEPRGEGGFGWDKIFIPVGKKITRGEMEEKEYTETSYRTKSFEALLAYIKAK